MEPSLVVLAPAKINLYLQVLGRREDGYHELATLFLKLALFDRLEIRPADRGIELSCPDSGLAADETNLVHRAARLFFSHLEEQGVSPPGGIRIVLRKKIPIAAGLGGGSSDAAAVLLSLNRLFRVGLSVPELVRLGVRLGADVPLFLHPYPCCWGTGIGDRLQAAPQITGYDILLVNPGFAVSTEWVFRNLSLTSVGNKINLSNSANNKQTGPADCPFLVRPIVPKELRNDLQEVTLGRYRVLREIKEQLLDHGAAAALMSGSGPTIFALFARQRRRQAQQCCQEMARQYPFSHLVQPLTAGIDAAAGKRGERG